MMFDILFQDAHMVAIYKPYGYFVHKTNLDAAAEEVVLPLLRDQLGQYVYPVHRLDRKTSGVLLFALNPEVQLALNNAWMTRAVEKNYVAIVRGWLLGSGEIDYPLTNLKGRVQDAVSVYQNLATYEISLPHGKFPTSRYSFVGLQPITGRTHQLRKHLSHIFHPIIGDRPHGCNKQNKLFLDTFDFHEMLLHASSLQFEHPVTKEQITIAVEPKGEFERIKRYMEENNLAVSQ